MRPPQHSSTTPAARCPVASSTAPTGTQLLTTQRLAELAAAGVVLTGIDDVIAVERLG